MGRLVDFYKFNERELRKILESYKEEWMDSFLKETTHGFKHGYRTVETSRELGHNLNREERVLLEIEGKYINGATPFESAMGAVVIGSLLHDCGRFDEKSSIKDTNAEHPYDGARKAWRLCSFLEIGIARDYIIDAILGHEYQNENLTPTWKKPETMIGRIVQASDQLMYMHPDSVERTLEFGDAIGRPFYMEMKIEERTGWTGNNIGSDSLTVLLRQIFGPTGEERFGVKFAKTKIEGYRKEFKKRVIEEAEKLGIKEEVTKIIEEYGRIAGAV